jgi:hypothetical protein
MFVTPHLLNLIYIQLIRWLLLWSETDLYRLLTFQVPNLISSGVLRNSFGGVQQIHLRIEVRENGDLGAVAPQLGVTLNLQMNETHILIRLLLMYIKRKWEFGSGLAKLQNFWGICTPKSSPLFSTPLVMSIFRCLRRTKTISPGQSLCR